MTEPRALTELLDAWHLRAGMAADRLLAGDRVEAPRRRSLHASGFSPGDEVLGRYTIAGILGEGAFGRVYRADDAERGEPVAIKELRPGTGSQASTQLAQEFFTLSRLRHPHIVGVYDYGQLDDDRHILVMELVTGQDVADQLKHGPLPRDAGYEVLLGLLRALTLLHSRLYVHGDIKAENIRVTTSGSAKLMDFGLLHQLGTPASQVQGTLEYIAPEVLKGGVVDGRTDLYATGVLAYELLTGALPFEGDPGALIRQHLQDVPKPPSHFLNLPPDLDAFVLRLLEKEPAQRFRDASEALAALGEVAGVDVDDAPTAHRTAYLFAADLVGRDRERARLAEARRAVGAGQVELLLIGGRAGEGKSRLYEELKLQAKIEGLGFTSGQCRQGGMAPREPVVEALTPLVAKTPAEVLEVHGPALASLLPEVGRRGIEAATSPDPAQAKAALYDALTHWLSALGRASPMFVCFEDLHWSDAATVDVFNHLARNLPPNAGIGLLGTLRTDEVDATHQVLTTVHERRTELLALGPLSREALAALLGSTLGEFHAPEAFLDELAARSDGNAFFVIETLRWLVEADLLQARAGVFSLADDLPALATSIAELVTRRLAHLPPNLLRLCQVSAPVGRVVDLDLCADLTGATRDAMFEGLEALVERQVLTRSRRELRFAHDTLRDGVVQSLPDDDRVELHGRIANVLVGRSKRDPVEPAQLAFHLKRSARPLDAVPYLERASARAMAADQQLEATLLLVDAVDLLERPDDDAAGDGAQRRDHLIRLYDQLAIISPRALPPMTVRAADRLEALWGERVNLEDALHSLARHERFVKRLPGPLRSFVEHRDAATSFDPAGRDPRRIAARLLEHQASQAFNLAVLGQTERALSLAEHLSSQLTGDRASLQVWCEIATSIASLHLGHTNASREAATRARQILEDLPRGIPPLMQLQRFLASYFQAMAEVLSGLPPTTEAVLATEALAASSNKPQDRLAALLPHIVAACLSGRPKPFAEASAEADAIIQRLNHPQPLTNRCKLWVPVFYLDRGELDLAEAVIQRLERYAASGKDAWLHIYSNLYRGLLLVERAEHEAALPVLRGAVEAAERASLGRVTWARAGLARALHGTGDRDAAVAQLSAAVERLDDPELACPYDEALVTRQLGEITGERALLERAASVAARIDNPIQEGLARRALGALLDEHAPQEAERERRRAEECLSGIEHPDAGSRQAVAS